MPITYKSIIPFSFNFSVYRIYKINMPNGTVGYVFFFVVVCFRLKRSDSLTTSRSSQKEVGMRMPQKLFQAHGSTLQSSLFTLVNGSNACCTRMCLRHI